MYMQSYSTGQSESLGEEVECEVARGAGAARAGKTHRMSASLAVYRWAEGRGLGKHSQEP